MALKKYVSKDGGSTFYYRDPEMDIYHRERGLPAWEWYDGVKEYLENDQWHRLDDSAVDWDYHKCHFLNGKQLFRKFLT